MKKMIKEVLIGYVAIVLTILFGLNVYKAYDEQANKLSDQAMMEQYIECTLGDGCHGTLLPDDGDEYVNFVIYNEDNEIVHGNWCFEREYFEKYIE